MSRAPEVRRAALLVTIASAGLWAILGLVLAGVMP